MKTGIPNSHALEKLQVLAVETLADAYAALQECDPIWYSRVVRNNDMAFDSAYIVRRSSDEGLAFLTTTLPRLGEWLDEYVWNRQVLPRVEGFKPYNGRFPCFLRPFWIFLERLHEWNVQAAEVRVYHILRTLTLGFKKLEVPYAKELADAKISSFLEIEKELSVFEVVPTRPEYWYCQEVMEQLLRNYQVTCDRPKHGPGAVAGGERHNQKWNFSDKYMSVHAEFPYWEYFFPVRSAIGDLSGRSRPIQLAAMAKQYRALKPVPEPTARLLLVPKDSRGPRVISCEPKELMYLQQGVSCHLMDYIERHWMTRGHVNFEDQTINGCLALEHSMAQGMDTIDLSDASDRVSVALVKFLVPERVSKKWLALRSTATRLPDGELVPLHKFAPMGSALCFPVESIVFWSLAVGTIWSRTGNLLLALSSVYVYGDDIIVASEHTDSVIEMFNDVHLMVNKAKCFCGNHPFRESCGVDAFRGFNVTPSRIKKVPPKRPSDGTAITAWVKYAENSQYTTPRRSNYELQLVQELVGPIPRVPFPQEFLSFVTSENVWSVKDYTNATWSVPASYWRAKLIRVKNRTIVSAIPCWSRLQRNLILRSVEGDPSLVVDRASTLIGRKMCNISYLGA